MDRKLRRNIRLPKTTPTCNRKEVEDLLDLLFYATKENNAHCARLLGISTPTWKRWTKEPPTEWYWPIVLRAAIKHTLSSVIAQRRATSKKFQNEVLTALSKIPNHKDFEEEIADMAYDIRGAQMHLRDLLAAGGRWWSDIQLTANSGGYTKITLRKAARALGVRMKQEGYGADKDSFWRLPSEDED